MVKKEPRLLKGDTSLYDYGDTGVSIHLPSYLELLLTALI